MSKMQAVILGWDIARPDSEKTIYSCPKHGSSETACACIDAYFKSQVREAQLKRLGEKP